MQQSQSGNPSASELAALIGGGQCIQRWPSNTGDPRSHNASYADRPTTQERAPASSLDESGTRPGQGRGVMLPERNLRSVEAANPTRGGEVPPSGGNCESEEAEQPEGGVHRGKVAGLVNEREDQPGDRTGDAG